MGYRFCQFVLYLHNSKNKWSHFQIIFMLSEQLWEWARLVSSPVRAKEQIGIPPVLQEATDLSEGWPMLTGQC